MRYAVAAGSPHLIDGDDHDLARPERFLAVEARPRAGAGSPRWRGGRCGRGHRAVDPGRSLEGAEHDRQATIGVDMCRRLIAAAGTIEIGDGARIEDAELIGAAGRDVDVGLARRRGGEEDALARDEVAMCIFDPPILLGHGGCRPVAPAVQDLPDQSVLKRRIASRSPRVEPSRPTAGALPSTIGKSSLASTLPSSTPHWSKELIPQITPWTKTLCS